MTEPTLLVTCEHAVNLVPDRWRPLFAGQRPLLDSHRGYDPGALALARHLAAALSAPCFASRVTRLLVDHNRSPHNRALWSAFSRGLPAAEKTLLLEDYYLPFRRQTGHWLAARLAAGQRVVHLSVHSFTPVLDGRERLLDIGILYDPRRRAEARFSRSWQQRLVASSPQLRVRLNQPYRGRSDSHQSTYRKESPAYAYLAIELEINQALNDDPANRQQLFGSILDSLRTTLSEMS